MYTHNTWQMWSTMLPSLNTDFSGYSVSNLNICGLEVEAKRIAWTVCAETKCHSPAAYYVKTAYYTVWVKIKVKKKILKIFCHFLRIKLL